MITQCFANYKCDYKFVEAPSSEKNKCTHTNSVNSDFDKVEECKS